MSFINDIIKGVIGETKIYVGGSKIGYLFDSPLLNVSTSGVGTAFTGISCVKAVAKMILSPMPSCKILYGFSSASSEVSCVASTLCLLSSYSSIAPVPVFFGTVGWAASFCGIVCNRVGDLLNPTASVTSGAVETFVDDIFT
jgi:hypothetical protein